ncbi:hypothetical protein TcCL_Unassigned04130, partial [Trypanosoma cruzi]
KKGQLRRQEAGAVCHWRCPAHWAHRRRASVTARTLHTPGATPPALTAVAPWDVPLTNKSHEHTRIHPQRLPTASTHREVKAQAWEGQSKQRTHKKMLNPSISQSHN